jgi:hypothetical protein
VGTISLTAAACPQTFFLYIGSQKSCNCSIQFMLFLYYVFLVIRMQSKGMSQHKFSFCNSTTPYSAVTRPNKTFSISSISSSSLQSVTEPILDSSCTLEFCLGGISSTCVIGLAWTAVRLSLLLQKCPICLMMCGQLGSEYLVRSLQKTEPRSIYPAKAWVSGHSLSMWKNRRQMK